MIVSGKIYTDKGIKYIHEVTMGDNVFDHKGEMTRVTGVAKKFVSPKTSSQTFRRFACSPSSIVMKTTPSSLIKFRASLSREKIMDIQSE